VRLNATKVLKSTVVGKPFRAFMTRSGRQLGVPAKLGVIFFWGGKIAVRPWGRYPPYAIVRIMCMV